MPSRTKEAAARRPSQIFAERVREAREARRWSQQDLADRLAALGDPVDRATVARTETGARGVSLDDAVVYTAALGSQFIHMLVGMKGEEVAIGPALRVSAGEARRWLRGQLSLRAEDDRAYFSDLPKEEWLAMQELGIRTLLDQVQTLVDAAVADDKQAMSASIEDINAELDRQRAWIKRQEQLEQALTSRKGR